MGRDVTLKTVCASKEGRLVAFQPTEKAILWFDLAGEGMTAHHCGVPKIEAKLSVPIKKAPNADEDTEREAFRSQLKSTQIHGLFDGLKARLKNQHEWTDAEVKEFSAGLSKVQQLLAQIPMKMTYLQSLAQNLPARITELRDQSQKMRSDCEKQGEKWEELLGQYQKSK